MNARRIVPALALCAFALALGACTGSNDELREWMADVRKDMKPVKTTIAEPKTFEPFIYRDQNDIDPFDPSKVANALKSLSAKSNNGLAPDLTRRREPLETYPLDTITMVGTLQNAQQHYALLRADAVVYQIKVGNYVGQNFGLVTGIDENEVTLKEVVQDAAGEWVERTTTLQLQENKR